MAAITETRRSFVEEFGFCFGCGQAGQLAVHEMACGSHRERALDQRYAWLCACWVCNSEEFTNYERWPLERQLALKWIHDRKHFELRSFNELRGRAPDAITMSEVIPFICRELDA